MKDYGKPMTPEKLGDHIQLIKQQINKARQAQQKQKTAAAEREAAPATPSAAITSRNKKEMPKKETASPVVEKEISILDFTEITNDEMIRAVVLNEILGPCKAKKQGG